MTDQIREPHIPIDQSEILGTKSYIGYLTEIGVDIPDPLGLERSLGQVLDSNGLTSEFLATRPKESLLLSAVAQQTLKDTAGHERRQIAIDAILGRQPKQEEAKQRAQEAVIDQYTNPELSAELARVFEGPLFEDVRMNLGIDQRRKITDLFGVKVLDIATNKTMRLPFILGLDPESWEQFNQHHRRLMKRGIEFARQMGEFEDGETLPSAWMNPANAEQQASTIFMPAIGAEEVIASAGIDSSSSNSSTSLNETRHEFVHCVGDLFLGGDSFTGVGLFLEERRAEFYSGDRNGDFDVKDTLDFILSVYGVSIDEIFPKGIAYSPESVYTNLAVKLGLENTLDLFLAIPSSYEPAFDEEGGFSKQFLDAGNSVGDVFRRFLERTKDKYGEEHLRDRVSGYVDDVIAKVLSYGVSIEFVPDNIAFSGPDALRTIAIKDFLRRYPDATDYDWESALGDSFLIDL